MRLTDQLISDRKTIALKLARLYETENNLIKSVQEEAQFNQIFSFVYGTIEPSCSTNHPDMFVVLEVRERGRLKAQQRALLINIFYSFLDS